MLCQTLDGIFYISIGRTSCLEIDKSKLPDLAYLTNDGHNLEYTYTFVNSKLTYGGVESVYIGMSIIICELLEGTYSGEVTIVDNDFFNGWFKQ